ncbi:nitrite reductase large subunit NirB [Arthrobacter sp. Rue61a]|uniref:nitrite reductase large subunit NirB n=1 Tax=Arthrobacter sp. Rue61a TaxID=1118963 RepID=UPI00027DF4EB|nr:nitrite reductase large subunit NirB [Arthrobacter sp. Rue61a]AFR30284.1 nitrite reductase [NAD(P)H] [Arthrobacter sp. Rue61a]
MRRRLVVIGNGMAGARAVEEILARGGADVFDITMFGDEPYGNYNRIMLSHVLSGEESDADIFLNALPWYRENNITLHAGVRVDRIDKFSKHVFAADGRVEPYDVLIIATGSRSHLPPMGGVYAPSGAVRHGVFTFRTLDDTRKMIQFAHHEAHHDHRRKAVVIGGGLLGLEAAHGLQANGLDVAVVHSGGHLMNAQLGPDGGAILRRSVEALGIEVHTGSRTTAILGSDQLSGVRLRDDTEIDCDMVVVTAGIRPNVDIAVVSGLAVERGIVVDDQLRVMDEDDIYAVGECVQHRGEVYGLVAPLWEQAAVLADQVTGMDRSSAYLGSRTATKLKVAGVDVASMGLSGPERDTDEHIVFSEPGRGVFKSIVIRDNKMVGATLLGDHRKVAYLTQAFDQGLPLPEERLSLMFDLGSPGEEESVAELADSAQVCNCNGVSKGALVAAVRGGCASVSAAMDATRAGKGCGSCKLMVTQVVEWAAGGAVEEDLAAGYYVPGIPLDKPALMAEIRARGLRSVSQVFAALAPGSVEDAKSKMALASLMKMMLADLYIDERDARFINDRVHANIQRDGTFSVVPQMKGGVTSVQQLRRIADVAEKHSIPMIKLTGGQRIDLLGVPKEDLPQVWADLDMPSGYAYGKSFRTVKTCVGKDYCRFGTGDSTGLGISLESRFQGIEAPAKLKLAVSGCPRNCAESLVKDVGVVAVEGGRWEIYIGGAAGAHIRKGDLLVTVDTPEEVTLLAGRFMQYYRENANWLERSYSFVPRVGIDHIRSVILDDSEGIAAQLDAAMQASVDSYVDPWSERDDPLTPGQFRTSLPLTVLPQVPVR